MTDSLRRPRVLFVAAVSDIKGGAERVLMTMLASPYLDPVLVCPEPGGLGAAVEALGIPVHFYHPGALANVHRPPRTGAIIAAAVDAVRCAWRIHQIARAHNCDIVHSNGLRPHALAAILGLLRRERTVVHLHDIPYRRIERLIWRAIGFCVMRIIVVSAPCWPDRDCRKISVVMNGVIPVRSVLPLRHMGKTLRLGFIGRFHPHKGLDRLLDWFKAIRNAGLDATLRLRGRPDPDQPEYWARISARIDAEGLSQFITYDGWLEGPALYDSLDVVLLSSDISDPAPLVVLEAMSAGVLVAAYPAGGIPHMIAHSKTGFLVTEPADLVTVLKSLRESPEYHDSIRTKAHAAVLGTFSPAAFHRRLAEAHAEALWPGHPSFAMPSEAGKLA